MFWTKKRTTLISLALAFVLGITTAVVQADKDEVKAAERHIEAQKKAAFGKADRDYKIAKKRCDRINAEAQKKTCLQQAKDARDAAQRQAKIEKAQRMLALRDRQNGVETHAAAPVSTQERYLAEKARCDLQGPDRDRCLAAVKQKYGKS